MEYDPTRTDLATLKQWVEECGLHCAGGSVPGHICDPLADENTAHEPAVLTPDRDADEHAGHAHDHTAVERAADAHGHGHGGHAGMLMAGMVCDMWCEARLAPRLGLVGAT